MHEAEDTPDNLPYWTQQRRELASWFKDRAPSFVDGYSAALRLLYTPGFPARVHLVSHLVRDIYRYLPAAIGTKGSSRPAEVFPGMVKDLVAIWDRVPPSPTTEIEAVDRHVLIHANVYNYVVKIVEKSRQFARDKSTIGRDLLIALFRSGERSEDEFIQPWVFKAFDDDYDFFVRKAHLAIDEARMPTDDRLLERFEAFEHAFHSMIGSYFTGKDELDAILQDTNTTAD
jgi:hypothetical protein